MGHLRILILSVVIAISVYAFYMQFYCHQITSRYQRYSLTLILLRLILLRLILLILLVLFKLILLRLILLILLVLLRLILLRLILLRLILLRLILLRFILPGLILFLRTGIKRNKFAFMPYSDFRSHSHNIRLNYDFGECLSLSRHLPIG
jgi:hypothetical protein